MYRLDKTAFKAQTFAEADNTREYWLAQPPHERLRAAWWLTCKVYGIDYENQPRLDRTVFSMRKHENR